VNARDVAALQRIQAQIVDQFQRAHHYQRQRANRHRLRQMTEVDGGVELCLSRGVRRIVDCRTLAASASCRCDMQVRARTKPRAWLKC
jgi:hypothetical protein